MNRRKMLAAASTLALAGCGGDEKNDPAKKTTATEAPKAATQELLFKSHLNLPVKARGLTPKEAFMEANVVMLVLTALHQSAMTSLGQHAAPTAEMSPVDKEVYAKVKDYMTQNPGVVEPAVGVVRGLVQELTIFAANSPDTYTGDPNACLTADNLGLIQKSLKTVVKPS